MNKILLRSAVIFLSAGITTSSFATQMQGAYVNGNLGATQFPGITFKNSANSLSLSSKIGLAGGLALGSQNDNMRVELAANYWENKIKHATLHPITPIGLDSTVHNGTGSIALAMINGYYDLTPQASFAPYLGLGIGVARLSTEVTFDSNNKVRGSHNAMAYQAIVGAAWDVAPCVKANIDYRYLITGPQKVNLNQLSTSSNLGSHYQNHRISAGLTYYMY